MTTDGVKTLQTQDILALVPKGPYTSAPVPNCPEISALVPKCLKDNSAPRKTLRHQATLDQAMARRMAVLV